MFSRTIPVPLLMGLFSTRPDDLAWVCCMPCGRPLDLHQPDVGSPERMLGVCSGCGGWYIMDVLAGGDEAVMVALPDPPYFFAALTGDGRGADGPTEPQE